MRIKSNLRLIMRANYAILTDVRRTGPGTQPSDLVHSHHFQYPYIQGISSNKKSYTVRYNLYLILD